MSIQNDMLHVKIALWVCFSSLRCLEYNIKVEDIGQCRNDPSFMLENRGF